MLLGTYNPTDSLRFSSLFTDVDVSRGVTSATQRQKFHADDVNLSGIRSEALIGRRTSYVVLAIIYEFSSRNVPGGEERGETDVLAGYPTEGRPQTRTQSLFKCFLG